MGNTLSTSFSFVVANLAVKMPLPAFYIDNLRSDDPVGDLLLINLIPQDDELDVPITSAISMQIVTPGVVLLAATTKVRIKRDTGAWEVAYDETLGGFQIGFNGPDSVAAAMMSPDAVANDELWLTIDPEVLFTSEQLITVEVSAALVGDPNTVIGTYSFIAEDITPANPVEINWLTPCRCRVRFDEKLLDSTSPGGGLFMEHIDEGLEICTPNIIRLLNTVPSPDWSGYYLGVTGSSFVQNNGHKKILGVNALTREIFLDTAVLRNDTGVDYGPNGDVQHHRRLRATVTPYKLEARLADEGLTEPPSSDARVQCAYEPIPLSVRFPLPDELKEQSDREYWLDIRFQDGVSFGRMYRFRAINVTDQDGNNTGAEGTTLDFVTPLFGLRADRMRLWESLLPTRAKVEDMAAEKQLRKVSVVIQDLTDQVAYWVKQLEYLRDPSLCPESYLDDFLYSLGLPFRFPLTTEVEKRRMLGALCNIIRQTGVELGIEEMLTYLLGTPLTVRPYLTAECWILGTSQIGGPAGTGTAILGPSGPFYENSYEVIKLNDAVTLTAEQLARIREISEWADPVDMHLLRIVENLAGTSLPLYWELGTSVLGMSTLLR